MLSVLTASELKYFICIMFSAVLYALFTSIEISGSLLTLKNLPL